MCLSPDPPETAKPSPPPSSNSQALANPYPESSGQTGLSKLRVGNSSAKARTTARNSQPTSDAPSDFVGPRTGLQVGGAKSTPRTPPRAVSG